jgi:post-segregation antitoxin (ccd killing protein)
MRRRPRIDMSRVAATALETAINGDRPQRPRFRGLRAIATGAALVGAARVAASKVPQFPRPPQLADLADDVRDRLADRGWIEGEAEPEEEFDEDEEPEDEDEADEDEEPEDEAEEEEEEEEDSPSLDPAAQPPEPPKAKAASG